jgi:hypothetical protein
VELEHRGFERLAALAKKACRGYDIGWDLPFGRCYADAVNRSTSPRWLLRGRRFASTAAMIPRLVWPFVSMRLHRT